MRKSELLAIKKKEYERGLSDAKLTISNRDVRGWADEAEHRVAAHKDLGYIFDVMKEMLREIGITICPATSNVVDKEGEDG